jgi:hypothetical protein
MNFNYDLTDPTLAKAQPNKSGLWLLEAPTSRPPFDLPLIVNLIQIYIFCVGINSIVFQNNY